MEESHEAVLDPDPIFAFSPALMDSDSSVDAPESNESLLMHSTLLVCPGESALSAEDDDRACDRTEPPPLHGVPEMSVGESVLSTEEEDNLKALAPHIHSAEGPALAWCDPVHDAESNASPLLMPVTPMECLDVSLLADRDPVCDAESNPSTPTTATPMACVNVSVHADRDLMCDAKSNSSAPTTTTSVVCVAESDLAAGSVSREDLLRVLLDLPDSADASVLAAQ